MSRKQLALTILVVAAAVIAVAVMVVQLRPVSQQWPAEDRVASTERTPGDGTFLDPDEVDRTDPDAVAEAAALLTASHDTATDYTETAALKRTGDLFAPELRESITEPERGAGGQSWVNASRYEAYAVPAATMLTTHAQHDHGGTDHGHEDEVLSAAGEPVEPYEFRVTYRWQGREGEDGLLWSSHPDFLEVRTVQMSLAERDGRWYVVEHLYLEPAVTDYEQ